MNIFREISPPVSADDAGRQTRVRPPAGLEWVVDFTLRGFQSDDFEVLWRIDQGCFPPGISYSRRELAAYLRAPGAFAVVAETSFADGDSSLESDETRVKSARHIAGFIVAESTRRGIAHIITIDVLQEARRFGIGSKLLGAAEERLRAANCRQVRLESAVNNSAALNFYKHYGYALVQTIPRYYSNGVDAFVLQKSLGDPRSHQ